MAKQGRRRVSGGAIWVMRAERVRREEHDATKRERSERYSLSRELSGPT